MVYKCQHQRQPHRHQPHTIIHITIRVIILPIMETTSTGRKRMEIVIVTTITIIAVTANGVMDGNGR